MHNTKLILQNFNTINIDCILFQAHDVRLMTT
jgi:hypothetical protein